MKEIWKPIKGFENKYEISNLGRIKNVQTNHILKLTNQYGDYFNVVLYNLNKQKSTKIHRLVAEAFIPNLEKLPCVNHKDGNKQNNRVDNLEWCTYKANMQHAVENGLIEKKFGEKNKNSQKYVELDKNYKFIRTFIGSREENKKLGYSKDTIQRCARGTTLSTHNKIYLFFEEYYSEDIEKTKKMHMQRHKKYLMKRRKMI